MPIMNIPNTAYTHVSERDTIGIVGRTCGN